MTETVAHDARDEKQMREQPLRVAAGLVRENFGSLETDLDHEPEDALREFHKYGFERWALTIKGVELYPS